MWEIVVFLAILLISFYLYRSRNVSYWKKRGVVTASGANWFFGHYKPLLFMEKHMGPLFVDICREFPDAAYIGVYKLYTPGLVVRDPDVIRSILTTDFNCFLKNDIQVDRDVDKLLGANPFSQNGEEWKTTRSHVSPSLTFAKLKVYFPTITKVGDELVKYVHHKCEDGTAELEVKELSATYTTDVVANALCGIESNTFEDPDSLFAKITKELMKSIFYQNLITFFVLLFPEFAGKKFRITSKHAEDILVALTKQMLEVRSKSPENRGDVFQHYLNVREKDKNGVFTDEYIAGHVFSLIIDGYETSSVAICYALFELAWSEDVQDKLRNEVRGMISKTNGEYTIDDVEGLKYLDMVLSESLRLHPPLTVMTKECTSNYTILPNSNLTQPLTIKPGNLIMIPVQDIHMNPKYYPNPETFNPERFTEEAISNRHKYVYLPFGEGPRKCVGMRFGVLQTKVALIKLISNFRLKPSARTNYNVQIDPKVFIVTRPLGGAWVRFEKI